MELEKGNFDQLVDESEISRRRKKAEEEFRDLGSDEIAYLRRRCKNDLFFLASGPLEYDLISPRFHGGLCKWLGQTQHDQYRIILLPRGHYKSTLITIAESVQMALPNDAGVQAYPWSLGPNIKLLLAHENRESASRFLFEVSEAFLSKPLMLALFPDCIPSSRKQRINKWELELPRTTYHKEPTFDTIGAGGAAQGRHYHHIKLDDIIGEDARESETIMRRTINWFDNVNSLLTRLKIDGWDLIGTRWSYTDVYSHAMNQYGVAYDRSVVIDEDSPHGVMSAYVRGAIENGEPVFPEEFSMEKFDILRKNRIVWAAQYANNPRDSGLTEFDTRWLKFYNINGHKITVFAGEESWSVNVWDLDRTILVDPSVGESKDSDESGIVVTGTDKKNNVYILETVKKQLRPPDLMSEILKLHQKWYPRLVSIEKVTFSAVFKYWLQQKSQELGVTPNFYDYVPGSKRSKEERIRGLTNYFASGQVFILEGMHEFRDEYEAFPLSKSEHLLDALAQGPEIWSPGLDTATWDRYRRAEQEILESRSSLTGY